MPTPPTSRSPVSYACKSRDGFTLTELLVVIAIVGILAAILFPAISRARDAAYTAQGASNLRAIFQGVGLYANDHRGVYPASYGSIGPDGAKIINTSWWMLVFPVYCNSASVFQDPTDTTGFNGTAPATWQNNGQTVPNGKVSYGAIGAIGTTNAGAHYDYKITNKPVASLTAPARTVAFTDCQIAGMQLSLVYFGNYPLYTNQITTPHANGQKANVVFADGHTALMSETQIAATSANGQIYWGLPTSP